MLLATMFPDAHRPDPPFTSQIQVVRDYKALKHGTLLMSRFLVAEESQLSTLRSELQL